MKQHISFVEDFLLKKSEDEKIYLNPFVEYMAEILEEYAELYTIRNDVYTDDKKVFSFKINPDFVSDLHIFCSCIITACNNNAFKAVLEARVLEQLFVSINFTYNSTSDYLSTEVIINKDFAYANNKAVLKNNILLEVLLPGLAKLKPQQQPFVMP